MNKKEIKDKRMKSINHDHVRWICHETVRQMDRLSELRKRRNYIKIIHDKAIAMADEQEKIAEHFRKTRDALIKKYGEPKQ